MSSPNLNNLILVGGILAYVSMIFFGIDAALVPQSSIALMCKVRRFMIRKNNQTVHLNRLLSITQNVADRFVLCISGLELCCMSKRIYLINFSPKQFPT